MGIRIFAAMAFLTVVAAAAQQPSGPGPVANGVILGRVIDAVTKEALSGVRVEIAVSPATVSPAAPRPPAIRALTDDQGRFVFRQLLPGSYVLAATTGANGFEQSGFLITGMGHLIAPYLNGGYGQRRPNGPLQDLRLEQGAVVPDAVIALWKGASIDGTVVDEAGEPLVGLIVAAVRRTSDGVLTTGPTSRTDDRGMYHISALAPGDYAVVVPQTQVLLPPSAIDAAFAPSSDPLLVRQYLATGAPSPSQTGVLTSGMVAASTPPAVENLALPPAGRAKHTYQSTFHPAATSLDQARIITLQSGEEVTAIDVQLTPVPAVAVAGALVDGGVPVANFGVRLQPADLGDGTEVLEVASVATDTEGRFIFPLVPAGQYRLFAQRLAGVPNGITPQGGVTFAEPRSLAETAGAWAATTITVSDKSLNDIVLNLQAGYRASGRVVFDGQGAPPQRDRFVLAAVPTRAQRRAAPAPTGNRMDANDRISTGALAPGRYVFEWPVSLGGWSVESVTAAGRDIAGAFEITDADISDMVITLTDQPASIGGTVRSMAGVADFEAAVFMFPADRARWRDALWTPRLVRTVRADPTGVFLFQNVIPGDYLLVAVPDSAAGDWPAQTVLTRLSQVATPVRALRRQRISVPLSTVEVK